MLTFKQFIRKAILAVLVLALIFPSSVFANEMSLMDMQRIKNPKKQEDMIEHNEKQSALRLQVGNALKPTDEGKFLVVLQEPLKMVPRERKTFVEKQAFINASEETLERFYKKLAYEDIHVQKVCSYNLVFCGAALRMSYADANKVALMPEVLSIEYCTSYALPKAEKLPHKRIAKRDIDSNRMIRLQEIESKFKGAGRIVAVIDSGFDIHHPAMRLSAETKPRIESQKALKSLIDSQKINQGMYASNKIPFAYNYASMNTNVADRDTVSHGMHVAGIIGANPTEASPNGDIVRGVAPECQILAMKVFNNDTTSAEIYTLAIEDAIKLGADAINMSIGAPLGKIGDMQLSESATLRALESARDMGVVVTMAGGNEGVYGGGLFKPTTAAPDYGLVDSPSIAPLALSVASCNNTHVTSKVMELKAYPDKVISYRKGNGPAFDDPSRPMNNFCAIVDCGYGSSEDVDSAVKSQGGLYGKIALIQRGGDLTFGEKVFNVGKKGAAGAIIYNDANGGSELVSMMISNPYPVIPSVFIGHEDGKFLISKIENSEEPKVRIGSHHIKTANPEGGKLSAFSSWGLSVDGDLKPEILAPGGNIFSTVANGSYVTMSGTSMATPHVAGAVALLGERADAIGLSGAEKYTFIKNMLMSTASPIMEKGVFVSPRGQGSGLINIESAVKSPVYAKGTDGRSAVLCKNVGDKFSVDITLLNCDATKSYKFKPKTFLTTDAIENDRYSLQSNLLGEYAGETVEVPAGGEAKVHINLDTTPFTEEQNKLQPYGYYLEGYTQFEAIDGAENISVPFVAFHGDWEKLPAIEDSIYNLSANGKEPIYHSESSKHFDFTHYETTLNGERVVCGEYLDENGNRKYDANKIAFSPNGDNEADSIRFFATFTRCYQNVKFGIYRPDDIAREEPLAFDYKTDGGLKSFNYGMLAPRSYTSPMWEWSGESAPEGRYDAVIQVSPYTSPQNYKTIIHSIILDKTPAKIEQCSYDSLSRKFTLNEITDKDAAGKNEGSGVRDVNLSYNESGTLKYIELVEKSAKNKDSTWRGPKSWILPVGIEPESINLTITDFAGNKLTKPLQEVIDEASSSKPIPSAPGAPSILTNEDGSVSIIPPKDTDLSSITVNYLGENGNRNEIVANKIKDEGWKLEKTIDGIAINGETGIITIAEEAVQDNSQVTAKVKNSSGKESALVEATVKTKPNTLNKQPLENKIAEAEKITQGKKTDQAFKALQEAIKAAKESLKTVKTNDEVTGVVNALSQAIKVFNNSSEKDVVNKSDLKTQLDAAEAIKPEGYTKASFEAMVKAKNAAQAIYENNNATQEAVDQAKTNLQKAIAALEKEIVADKKPLENKIAEVEKITQGKKTDQAFKALQEAIKAAKESLKTVKTNDDISQAVKVLEQAEQRFYNSADKVDPKPYPTPSEPTKPEVKPQPGKTQGYISSRPSESSIKEQTKQPEIRSKQLETQGINFTDTIGHWAKHAIDYVVEKGYFKGVGNDQFAPNKSITRGDFVTVLGRMAGIDQSKYTSNPFSDLENNYATAYIIWAAENDIVKGVGNGKFESNRPITREEMAVVMSRYLYVTGKTLQDKQDVPFNDQSDISPWAQEAVKDMAKKGIVQGMENRCFSPKTSFTRAQVAQVLYNLDKNSK